MKVVGQIFDRSLNEAAGPRSIRVDMARNFNHEHWKIGPIGGVFSSTVFDRGPVENVFTQSCNGRLRDECLNQRQFT